MKYLIVCAGDRSKHQVALKILEYFFKEHKNEKNNIFVCVIDKDKNICNLLKKKKINFTTKKIKIFLKRLRVNEYDWLLNIWGSLIYKNDILIKFRNNLNLHPSYLPYAKGKDPYVWSVQRSYPLGVTIHEMNSQIDSGKYFIRKKFSLKFPYTGGDVFNFALKLCIKEFKKNWKKIKNKKIKKKKLKKIKEPTFKRKNLINDSLIDLNKNQNLLFKNFVFKVLSHDFKFNKLQVKMGKKIYNLGLSLKKTVKKDWTK